MWCFILWLYCKDNPAVCCMLHPDWVFVSIWFLTLCQLRLRAAGFSGSSNVTSCRFQRFFCQALTDQVLCGRLIPHRFIQNQRYRPECTSSEGSSAQTVIWSILRFSLHLAGADHRACCCGETLPGAAEKAEGRLRLIRLLLVAAGLCG